MDDITTIQTLNLEKVCRICLLESEGMFSIFSELYDNTAVEVPCIYEILISLSNIKIELNDGLPNMICMKCLDSARAAHSFQSLCNKSQEILDNCLTQLKSISEEELKLDSDAISNWVNSDLIQQDEPLDIANNKVILSIVKLDDITDFDEAVFASPNPELLSNSEYTISSVDLNTVISPNMLIEQTKIPDSKTEKEEKEPVTTTTNIEARPVKKIENGNMKYITKILPNGEKVFGCSQCDKHYKYKNSLRIHFKNHSDEKPYICSTCNKGFKCIQGLIYHQKSHSDEKPFSCKICGKAYKQSGTLTSHMRTHTGDKPFLCSICGKGFRQAPDLNYHMRTHTKEKPYMCNICGKTMTMQGHLVQHMRIHTGEKPFKCKVCKKAFLSTTSLKRHELVHTGLKPYTCDMCDKSFNRASSLRLHVMIHSDERPYRCQICNRGFIQPHGLRNHMTSIHTNGRRKGKVQGKQTKEEPPSQRPIDYVADDELVTPLDQAMVATIETVAAAVEAIQECPICGIAFQEESELETHFEDCWSSRES